LAYHLSSAAAEQAKARKADRGSLNHPS